MPPRRRFEASSDTGRRRDTPHIDDADAIDEYGHCRYHFIYYMTHYDNTPAIIIAFHCH